MPASWESLPPLTTLNYSSVARRTTGKCARVVKATTVCLLTPATTNPHSYNQNLTTWVEILSMMIQKLSSIPHDPMQCDHCRGRIGYCIFSRYSTYTTLKKILNSHHVHHLSSPIRTKCHINVTQKCHSLIYILIRTWSFLVDNLWGFSIAVWWLKMLENDKKMMSGLWHVTSADVL